MKSNRYTKIEYCPIAWENAPLNRNCQLAIKLATLNNRVDLMHEVSLRILETISSLDLPFLIDVY